MAPYTGFSNHSHHEAADHAALHVTRLRPASQAPQVSVWRACSWPQHRERFRVGLIC